MTRFAYTYTMAGTTTDTGLRHSVTDKDNNVTTYGYDALDHLTSAVTKDALGSTTSSYSYDYDAVGNRNSESVNGAAAISATFNDANQLTNRAGVTYSYDANGNQTGSSAGQALAYNAADQTTSLQSVGGSALSASYAGLNQVERRTAGATGFTNSLLGVTAETASGTTKATTRDPAGALVGLRSGADRFYYLFDGLGSVVAVTNSSGSVTNSYTYDPFGVTTETKALLTNVFNPWRYTGQYFDDATAMYKMGARYYQPELGRWTQQDPSGLDANAYAYVGGNPVNLIDPDGTCAIFAYPDGSCFGGILPERAEEAFDYIGGPGAIKDCIDAAGAGAALGALAGVFAAGAGAALAVPTGALIGCVGRLGVNAGLNRRFAE